MDECDATNYYSMQERITQQNFRDYCKTVKPEREKEMMQS